MGWTSAERVEGLRGGARRGQVCGSRSQANRRETSTTLAINSGASGMSVRKTDMFVDGRWIASSATEDIEVVNPATERTIATVRAGSAKDADIAVQAAAAAFPEWSRTSVEERAAIFRRLARLIETRADELTRVSVSEVGQPIRLASVLQTQGAVGELDLMAEVLPEIAWQEAAGT